VELRSCGSVVEIDIVIVDGHTHFSIFFAFKASVDGFRNGCGPYISVDCTALNGEWNGHMPTCLCQCNRWPQLGIPCCFWIAEIKRIRFFLWNN
jgi:hypothetical protein